MIWYEGKKLTEQTDEQELWKIVVKEGIDIPFEVYAEGDVSNATILEYMRAWVEENDEACTITEKRISY